MIYTRKYVTMSDQPSDHYEKKFNIFLSNLSLRIKK